MKIGRMWGALAVVASVSGSAVAAAALSGATNSAVTFTATGPGGLKIEGKTPELSVDEKDGRVTIAVALANLDTGIALRNKHMRDKYLEVAKFPRAELVIARSDLKLPTEASPGAQAQGTAPASMTMHGTTKPVTVTFSVKRAAGTSFEVEGTTKVDMKEFGIDVPSYLGVTVKPGVDIAARFTVADR